MRRIAILAAALASALAPGAAGGSTAAPGEYEGTLRGPGQHGELKFEVVEGEGDAPAILEFKVRGIRIECENRIGHPTILHDFPFHVRPDGRFLESGESTGRFYSYGRVSGNLTDDGRAVGRIREQGTFSKRLKNCDSGSVRWRAEATGPVPISGARAPDRRCDPPSPLLRSMK